MKKMRVCVVDDDNAYTYLVKYMIKTVDENIEVITFTDGDFALEYMPGNLSDAAALPDIILLDINMPRLDGWRFLAEYGKIAADSAKKIMIYVLSSSTADGDRARALREPLVTDFITKPLEADKFAEICRAFYSNNAG